MFRRPVEKGNVPLGLRLSLERTTSHISQVAFLFSPRPPSTPSIIFGPFIVLGRHCWANVLFEDDESADLNVLC